VSLHPDGSSLARHDPELNVPWVITLFGVFVLATAPPLLLLWRKGGAVNLEES
jgi:hypothetical protein